MSFLISDKKAMLSLVDANFYTSIQLGPYFGVYDSKRIEKFETGEYLALWDGEYDSYPIDEINQLINGRNPDMLLRGGLVLYLKQQKILLLFSDIYGVAKFFYKISEDEVIISSWEDVFLKAGCKIDVVSLMQYMKYSFVIGPYCMSKGVSRLMALQCIKIDQDGKVVKSESSKHSNLWAQEKRTNKQGIVDDAIDIIRNEVRHYPQTQLMFSAGWDSRLVLGALIDSKIDFSLFVHGDLESREVMIAEDMSKSLGSILHKKSFEAMGMTSIQMKKQLVDVGSALFPYWLSGSRQAAKDNRVLTSGIFGEHLGGHYSDVNIMKGYRKYVGLLQMLLAIEGSNQERGSMFDNLKEKYSYESWMFTQEFNNVLSDEDINEESNSRLKRVLESYMNTGLENERVLFERFYTEHRGSRRIVRQALNSTNWSDYKSIYGNADLVSLINAIPLKDRIHNRFSKSLIKRLAPNLLNYPMAATLVPASQPILIQELSRGIRKGVEIISKSGIGKMEPRLGWNNLEACKKDGLFLEVAGGLKNNIWNRERIGVFTEKSDLPTNAVFDMLCKAMTVDYYVELQSNTN